MQSFALDCVLIAVVSIILYDEVPLVKAGLQRVNPHTSKINKNICPSKYAHF